MKIGSMECFSGPVLKCIIDTSDSQGNFASYKKPPVQVGVFIEQLCLALDKNSYNNLISVFIENFIEATEIPKLFDPLKHFDSKDVATLVNVEVNSIKIKISDVETKGKNLPEAKDKEQFLQQHQLCTV